MNAPRPRAPTPASGHPSPTEATRPKRPFAPAGLRPGQVMYERVKGMPCMVISATGTRVRVVRPGGRPWETELRFLFPGTAYHCRQLDALARHVAYQRRG
ncbi:hypothetical protein [Streptomyces sp. NBC_00304]|uniref:hypothetical protein n=1 Tax=Streptomyces sp. NBC_00304 TaxID=2975706 RepID=UPI002E29598A|nr:hypothetical protein [Streptomyces sp. NBC_00304]